MDHLLGTIDKHRKARVLVAEDEDDLRLTICEWLEVRGYAVWGAQDGLEALDLASRQDFDVVVTDLKMPRCDGLHLLSALKARDPLVQVIFLTGQASMGDAIEALRHGRSFDFFEKPLSDLRLLEQTIARALVHRAQLADRPTASEDSPPPVQALPPGASEEPALVMAFNFLETHFREPISLREVAAATGYSPAYLTSLMRFKTGKTVQQWIQHFKLSEAQRLLASTDWPIQRIAETLGYANANYFHRLFRQAFGTSPQSWRLEEAPAERA